MPTYFARSSGNVNAAIWATTPSGTAGDYFSSFTSSDTLVANSFQVAINVNTTCALITNDATGGATASGGFTIANGVTLTSSIQAGGANCLVITGTVSASVVGAVNGSNTTANALGILHNGTGVLTITGALNGGSASGGTAVTTGTVGSGGATSITGNVSAGSGTNAIGFFGQSFAGPTTITGNVAASTTGFGVSNFSSALVTVVGNSTGSTSAGISNSTAGGVTVVGRVTAGALANGAPGLANATNSGGACIIDEAAYGAAGASPTSGSVRFADKNSNVVVVIKSTGGSKTLVDTASTTLLPAASDVRFGVSYNSGATTGTCRVPTAANVLQGVLVDATTGTLMLTAADFWAYATSSATTAGSMGERLKNAATVTSTGQQIADAVGA